MDKEKFLQAKRELKRSAYKREKGKCFWCERSIRIKNATLDHIIPKSRGGPLTIGNVVVSCERCNMDRADMPAADFLWKSMSKRGDKSISGSTSPLNTFTHTNHRSA